MSILNALTNSNSCLKEKCQKCLRGERNPCYEQCPLYLFKKSVDEAKYLEDVRTARNRRIEMFEKEEVNAKRKMQAKQA